MDANLLGFVFVCLMKLSVGLEYSTSQGLTPERNTSVLIVGGGLSGLSAAQRLSEVSGVKVHVTHETSQLGDDWADDVFVHKTFSYSLSKTHPVVFHSFPNTSHLLSNLHIKEGMTLQNGITLAANNYPKQIVNYNTKLLSLIMYLYKYMGCIPHWYEMMSTYFRLRKLLDFEYTTDKIRLLGGKSFATYLNENGLSSLYNCLFAPILSGSGYNATEISAFEAMRRLWTHYLMGNDHDSLKNYHYVRNVSNNSTIIQTFVNRLKRAGVTFHLNYTVRAFDVVESSQDKFVADHNYPNKFYDYIILASGRKLSQKILQTTYDYNTGIYDIAVALREVLAQINNLKDAPPRKVVKVMLNQTLPTIYDPYTIASGFKYVQSVVILDRYHQVLRDYSKSINATCLEVLVTNLKSSNQSIWSLIKPELVKLFPELRFASVLNSTEKELVESRSLEVNQSEKGPSSDYVINRGVSNFYLAGDYVATPNSAAIEIERKVSLGFDIADKILRSSNLIR